MRGLPSERSVMLLGRRRAYERIHMRKLILSLLTVVGLLLGVAGSVAPAQAAESVDIEYTLTDVLPEYDAEPMVTGSTVRWYAIETGIPKTIDLYNTNMSGNDYLQPYASTRYNVKKTCPKNDNYYLRWSRDGVFHSLAPGDCFWPSQAATYNMHLMLAD